MKEKTTEIWEKIKTFFGTMSKKTKIILVIVIAAISIIFLARWMVEQSKPWEVVFYDLTDSDMQQISTYILENGVIDYKFELDTGTILVPEGQADPIRAAIYMLGLPSSGTAYEFYTANTGAMSTDTDKMINSQYDLQNRLAAMVRSMDGIHNATVNFDQGEDRRYVLDSSNMSTSKAWVYVELSSANPLSDNVANAIRYGVSYSVADLSVSDVEISDNLGNQYSEKLDGNDAISEASYLKLELQQYLNNQIRTEIMTSLSKIYSIENIGISVNTEVDIDKQQSISTTYPMPEYGLTDETDGRGIVNAEVWSGAFYGEDGGYIGGLVGATPNSDMPIYPADTDGDGVIDWQGYTSGQIEYSTPETNTQTEKVAAVLTDVQIGVTINADAENGDYLTAEQLLRHVAVVARIPIEMENEKVSVLIAPFSVTAVEVEEEGIQSWVWFAIISGLALFLIIAIIIVILLRKKKREAEEAAALEAEEEARRLEAEQAAAELAAMAPADGADIMDVNTEKSMELRKELRTFVGNNPEIAATLLKNLMKGGEPVDAT